MNKIEGILFDMDGVLVDSEEALKLCCIEMLRQEYGIEATVEDFAATVGMGEDVAIADVMQKHGAVYSDEAKEKCYRAYSSYGKDMASAPPKIKETIDALKGEYRLAVASSADIKKVVTNLSVAGLTKEDFSALITGNDVKNKKPAPEIYLLAAKAIGVEPKNCLVVEDAVAGVKAGKAAGCTCVAVAGSFSKEELLAAGADYFVENTYEILNVIETK